jgi:hypothetical protein
VEALRVAPNPRLAKRGDVEKHEPALADREQILVLVRVQNNRRPLLRLCCWGGFVASQYLPRREPVSWQSGELATQRSINLTAKYVSLIGRLSARLLTSAVSGII